MNSGNWDRLPLQANQTLQKTQSERDDAVAELALVRDRLDKSHAASSKVGSD